MQYIPVIVIRN